MRDSLGKTWTVVAPTGMGIDETAGLLAQQVVPIILKRFGNRRATRQFRYPIVSSFLKRADLSIRFWDVLSGVDSSEDWRLVAKHDGQWLPIVLDVSTCRKYHEGLIAGRAISESIAAVPMSDVRFEEIPGSQFYTVCFGTPEEEARLDEFIERRKSELIAQKLVAYPLPQAHVEPGLDSRLRNSAWTCIHFYLDVPEVTPAIVRAVSDAMGRRSELILTSVVTNAVKAVFEGNSDKIESPPLSGYANWKDYVRMLYRANRLLMDSDSNARMIAYLNREQLEAP